MKNRIIIFIWTIIGIVASQLVLSGCSTNLKVDEDNEVDVSVMEYAAKPLTDSQELILRSCGMSNRKIEEMKRNGVPELTAEFVEAAETVLEKMQERYGITFIVRGGTIPDWSSSDFNIILCAAEGELAGKDFNTFYRLEGSEERCLYEGYYTLLKRLEIQEHVQKIADDSGIEMKIIAYAEGELGEDIAVSSEKAIQNIRVDLIGFVSQKTEPEELKNAAKKLEEKIKDYQIRDYRVYRIKHDSALTRLTDYESIVEVFPDSIPEASDYVYFNGELRETS